MGIADEILPPDRADQSPVTAPLRELLRHMTRGEGHRPSIEVVCDPDAYDKLRTYFQRPYRGQPSTFALPLPEGTAWFRRERTPAVVADESDKAWGQMLEAEGKPVPSWLQQRIAETGAASAEPATDPNLKDNEAYVLPLGRGPFAAAVTSTAPGGSGSAVYVGKYTEPKEKPE